MDSPLLMTGPLVRETIADRKTQTRRLDHRFEKLGVTAATRRHRVDPAYWFFSTEGGEEVMLRCPYGAPGDRLWVREAWRPEMYIPGLGTSFCIRYRADGTAKWSERARALFDLKRSGWRPSIHLPKWASRIHLEVLDVRVERVQRITEEDALAEGMPRRRVPAGRIMHEHDEYRDANGFWHFRARDAFRHTWDTINGTRGPWDSNHLVWAITYKRTETTTCTTPST